MMVGNEWDEKEEKTARQKLTKNTLEFFSKWIFDDYHFQILKKLMLMMKKICEERRVLAKACNFSSNLQIGPDLAKIPSFSTFLENIKIFVQAVKKFENKDRGSVVYFSVFCLFCKFNINGWVELSCSFDQICILTATITLNTDSA